MRRNAEVAHIIAYNWHMVRKLIEAGRARDLAPFTQAGDAYKWHHDYPERYDAVR
jgi:hypothetical protein